MTNPIIEIGALRVQRGVSQSLTDTREWRGDYRDCRTRGLKAHAPVSFVGRWHKEYLGALEHHPDVIDRWHDLQVRRSVFGNRLVVVSASYAEERQLR